MKKPLRYTPGLHRAALRHLRRADPVLASVADRHGPHRFDMRTTGSHFDAIARSIVSQQLSVKAAATIHGRFRELYAGAGNLTVMLARVSVTRVLSLRKPDNMTGDVIVTDTRSSAWRANEILS